MYSKWIEVRKHHVIPSPLVEKGDKKENKWHKPEAKALKVNVDASVFLGASTFSLGMTMKDQ